MDRNRVKPEFLAKLEPARKHIRRDVEQTRYFQREFSVLTSRRHWHSNPVHPFQLSNLGVTVKHYKEAKVPCVLKVTTPLGHPS